MKIKHSCSFRAIPAISIADHISVKISNFQFLTVFNQFVLLFVFISYLMFTSYNFVILFYLWRNKTYSLTQGGWKISKIKEGVKKKLGVETLKETVNFISSSYLIKLVKHSCLGRCLIILCKLIYSFPMNRVHRERMG